MKRSKPTPVLIAGPQRRSAPFGLRMDGDGADTPRTISGHGSIFGTLSEDLGGFREIIHPGAFDGVAERSDIRCLINHNPDLILGRSVNGGGTNLTVTANETGLAYTCTPSDTTYSRDLIANLDSGNITQSSFAFDMDWSKEGKPEDGGTHEWEYGPNDQWVLHIYRVQTLYDVSPVTYPAYEAADVRSALPAFERAVERRAAAVQQQKEQADAKAKAERKWSVEVPAAIRVCKIAMHNTPT